MSGDGAKSKGGRFNPVGVPALYFARTIEGCFVEQAHGFPIRFDPLTVCTYDLDIEGIVDLTTDPGRSAANVRLPGIMAHTPEDFFEAAPTLAACQTKKVTDTRYTP
jgi:RES domain-containing protein